MLLSHESVYLCNRIANTSGLPESTRCAVDPIAEAARSAAVGIADERRRGAVLDNLLKARDEAVRLLIGFMRADEHRAAIITDMKVDLAKLRGETKEAMADVLDKVKVETERAVVEALTETMKSSKPVVESLKGSAS